MEDADNPWEDNHFRDVGLKAAAPIVEENKSLGEEEYVALKTSCWRRQLQGAEAGTAPGFVVDGDIDAGVKKEAVFVPYCLRANRGGNGHMRVGLTHV